MKLQLEGGIECVFDNGLLILTNKNNVIKLDVDNYAHLQKFVSQQMNIWGGTKATGTVPTPVNEKP